MTADEWAGIMYDIMSIKGIIIIIYNTNYF